MCSTICNIFKIKNGARPAIDLSIERERETLLAHLLRALDEELAGTMSKEVKDEIENIFVTKVGQVQ